MNCSCGIYQIQSIIKPNRVYIGSSCNIEKRWNRHKQTLKKGNHHSIKLQRHYDKYGEIDLKFIILASCDRDDLLELEQYYMDVKIPYFNSCLFAGKPIKNKKPWNFGVKGSIPWNKGIKMKEEQRLRMLNHPVSDITKEKIRKNKTGYKYKISEKMKSYYKTLYKSVLQFSLSGEFIRRFDSLKETSEDGFVYQNISECCNNKRKTAGGFLWKYENT